MELIKNHPDQFLHDFQHNKKKVEEFADIPSNMVKNKVAGYITRCLASQKKEKLKRPIYE